MGSYLDNIFINNIKKEDIKTIVELGSRDLLDASRLYNYYKCPVYAFECNPDCLIECRKNYSLFNLEEKKNIHLIDNAVAVEEGNITFYAFDLEKYNNMGSSSMYKIDFSKRNSSDPDYNKPCPQKEVIVKGIRIDNFLKNNSIPNIDLLCMDLQGYELNALKSIGTDLLNVKYIITEASIHNTYDGGVDFKDLHAYLDSFNFQYISSNCYGRKFPNLNISGFSEFDALYINKSIL